MGNIAKAQRFFKDIHGFRPDIGLSDKYEVYLCDLVGDCWYARDFNPAGDVWTREKIMSMPGNILHEIRARAVTDPTLNPELHKPLAVFRQIMKCNYDDCRRWARAIAAYHLHGVFYGVPLCIDHIGYAIQVRRVFETDVGIYRLYEKGV